MIKTLLPKRQNQKASTSIMRHVQPMNLMITWLVVCTRAVIFVHTVITHDLAVCGALLVFDTTATMPFSPLIIPLDRLVMIVGSDLQRHCLERAKTAKRMRRISKVMTYVNPLTKRHLIRSRRDFIAMVLIVVIVMNTIVLMMVTKVKRSTRVNRKLRTVTQTTKAHKTLTQLHNR